MKSAVTSLFLFIGTTFAQLPSSDLLTISPQSAKAGSTFEITVSGTNLDDLTGLRFSNSRIQVKPVLKPTEELIPEPQPVANRFEVTIPADLAPAIHEVRTIGYFGLSTARPFMVTDKDSIEIVEEGDHSSREKAMELPIDTAVSGRVDAKAIDWYRFPAKKGRRLLIRLWAERLDSKMDGQLMVYDVDGRELERNQRSVGHDPMADFSAPSDGEYFLAVSDILYRGGGEHFYRLQISESPHIDFVFPPAGEPGKKSKFTVFGRNLPGGSLDANFSIDGKPLESIEVEIALPAESPAPVVFSSLPPARAALRGVDYQLENSNAVRVGFATAPIVLEDPSVDYQTVTIPCEIAGRFDVARDLDTFRFKGQKDKIYWIEVISDQMNSPADPFVFIEKIDGETLTKIAENDQRTTYFSADNLDATNVDSNDAAVSFTADEDGDYQVTIVDHYGGGGSNHLYRLAIRDAKPDFDLYALYERPLANGRAGWPATPVLRKGGTLAIRIVAPRRDGFDGEITVTATGLPAGVTAYPVVMSGKVDQGFLVFSAAADAAGWAGPIQITGKATIGAAEVTRQARSTALVWGIVFADAFRVRTKLDLETVLSVSATETTPTTLAPAEDKKWTVELGQKLEIPVKAANVGSRKSALTVQPEGLFGLLRSPPTVSIAQDATEGALTIDFTKNGNFELEPGTYQFTLQGTSVTAYEHNPGAAARAAAEQKRIEELIPKVAAELAAAKSAVTQAQAALDETKKNAAAASPEAKAELEKLAADAQAKLEAATKTSAAAEAKSKRAEALKVETEKAATAAAEKAKPKDVKFAIYSAPITVEVTPKAEEKK